MAVKRIGVMTSGGDAPGMNAAVRAVVRACVARGITPFGILRGYEGMVEGQGHDMSPRDVSNIIQRGGTILLTARSAAFCAEEGRRRAVENLRRWELDGVVLIGGDGTFRGGVKLGETWGGRIIGVPGTIDNDIYGVDYTIGFDTAINTALYCIDHIRDTAAAHERVFIIEVMGRDAGFIALNTGIAGGAEEILIPEREMNIEKLCAELKADMAKGKSSAIIVVAEGHKGGGAAVAAKLKELGVSSHLSVFGHIQRGGAPTAADRVLATKLGAFAVEAIIRGETGKMAGLAGSELVLVSLAECITKKKENDSYLQSLVRMLAT